MTHIRKFELKNKTKQKWNINTRKNIQTIYKLQRQIIITKCAKCNFFKHAFGIATFVNDQHEKNNAGQCMLSY